MPSFSRHWSCLAWARISCLPSAVNFLLCPFVSFSSCHNSSPHQSNFSKIQFAEVTPLLKNTSVSQYLVVLESLPLPSSAPYCAAPCPGLHPPGRLTCLDCTSSLPCPLAPGQVWPVVSGKRTVFVSPALILWDCCGLWFLTEGLSFCPDSLCLPLPHLVDKAQADNVNCLNHRACLLPAPGCCTSPVVSLYPVHALVISAFEKCSSIPSVLIQGHSIFKNLFRFSIVYLSNIF